MYNYPLWYLHVASFKNPINNHVIELNLKRKRETRLYLEQAKEILADKLVLFKANNNRVEQLTETKYLIHHPKSTDPLVVSILFDLDKFKRYYAHYFFRLTRHTNSDKTEVLLDILNTDKFCVDLNILTGKGKTVNTKLLTTDSINPLIIEDELEDLEVSCLTLGDVIHKVITTDVLLSATTNALDSKALKVFYLSNCYYQPKQLVQLCNDSYLTVNVVLDSNGDKYLLTTEDDDYLALLEAYNSVLGCVRKINYCQLQYAHIEYCDLFS